MQQKCDDTSISHSFRQCFWDNRGLSSNGGAIHFILTKETQQSSSLTVSGCEFLHCKESGSVLGGAVYAEYISYATVSDSFFYDCECGWSTAGPEGAGILLNYISTQPLIQSCSFVSCRSDDDGGGCSIYFSFSSLVYVVHACSYIHCKGTHLTSSQGGGVMLYGNAESYGCTDCLFCNSQALYGAGLYLYLLNYDERTYLVRFCFFKNNSVWTNGYGNDVALDCYTPTNNTALFEHCFSTTASKRIGYLNNTPWDATDVNWLPQTNANIIMFNSPTATNYTSTIQIHMSVVIMMPKAAFNLVVESEVISHLLIPIEIAHR